MEENCDFARHKFAAQVQLLVFIFVNLLPCGGVVFSVLLEETSLEAKNFQFGKRMVLHTYEGVTVE